jgi:hypothetical protein
MKRIGLLIGAAALILVAALPPAPGQAQSAGDYQTLASSQFAEPRPLGSEPLKVELQPVGLLQAALANPTPGRRILLIVRGERNRNDTPVPVSVYWSQGTAAKAMPPDDHLLGMVTLADNFGGKDHTSVLDVTDRLTTLSRIKQIPEPQTPPPPSVTFVFPADDVHPSGPSIEEVLVVASQAGKTP